MQNRKFCLTFVLLFYLRVLQLPHVMNRREQVTTHCSFHGVADYY